ncbi:hypothetical protein FKW77_004996 [Venturia effusa]|uniref:Actin-like ATPase domain-containing protein n=1 Tax=Venturia effusa TaxID=50376 RepID=A0A517LFF8_9PEZI|nr:hypothetical protein FKW77_004996 [Venturia effusa]
MAAELDSRNYSKSRTVSQTRDTSSLPSSLPPLPLPPRSAPPSMPRPEFPFPRAPSSLNRSPSPLPRSPPPSRSSTPRLSTYARSHPAIPYRAPFLIGIDFGTTFSGVAWAKGSSRSGNLDQKSIHVVTDWPGGGNDSYKVPTKIQYGANGSHQCGYEVSARSDSLQWFKLLLIEEEDIPNHLRDSDHIQVIDDVRERLARTGKTVVEVIADYLKFLWNNAIATIKRSETSALVDSTPCVVVLTFPLLWKPYAVQRMRDAAQRAGILAPRSRTSVAPTILHTVEEPEAAALAIYGDRRRDRSAFGIGQTFVVLDAGGGTCDLGQWQALKAQICSDISISNRKSGGLCGAAFLDKEFDKKPKEWVGKKKVKETNEAVYRRLLEDNWERVLKKKFDGSNRDWGFPAPPEWEKTSFKSKVFGRRLDKPTINNSELSLTAEKLKEVFKPILGQIYEFVLQQVSTASDRGKNPTAIVLAGGLGSNLYLYKFLSRKFSNTDIIQHPYPGPWQAICRGAVIRADIVAPPGPHLEADWQEAASSVPTGVISRKSRHSYGIVKFVDFVEGFHDRRDRWEMESVNRIAAINQMEWYIKRDDDMQDRQPKKMPWKRYLPEDYQDTTIGVDLFHCDPSLPTRKADHVRKLCTIHARLPPLSTLPVLRNDVGKKFHVVHFDFLMTPQGTSIEWTVWINDEKL